MRYTYFFSYVTENNIHGNGIFHTDEKIKDPAQLVEVEEGLNEAAFIKFGDTGQPPVITNLTLLHTEEGGVDEDQNDNSDVRAGVIRPDTVP